MKIVHWDEMFHPDFGYQINILPKIQARLGYDVTIISSANIQKHPKFKYFGSTTDVDEADKLFSEKNNVKVLRHPWYRVVSGRTIYKPGFIKLIKKQKPDMIFCHTNDTLSAIIIARSYRKLKIPIIFDNHMLEMASNNRFRKLFQWYFKTFVAPKIKKHKWKVIRTQDDDYIIRKLGVPLELSPYISFGSDTTLFYPDENIKLSFRKKHSIEKDDFVVLYAGKLDYAKGGLLLANMMKDKIISSKRVVFVIVGNTDDNEYGFEVEEILKQSENRVLRFPTQKYIDLPVFFQSADLCIFAKQSSLSIFDAQACALPVIAEDNHINVERLSRGNGFTFEAGNSDDFRNKILDIVNLDSDAYNLMSSSAYNYVIKDFDYLKITKEYNALIESEYNRQIKILRPKK